MNIPSVEFNKEFGAFLKQKREEADLTQAYVAEKLGYTSPQYISNCERGIAPLTKKALIKIVKMYKLKPQDVVTVMLRLQKKKFESLFK